MKGGISLATLGKKAYWAGFKDYLIAPPSGVNIMTFIEQNNDGYYELSRLNLISLKG